MNGDSRYEDQKGILFVIGPFAFFGPCEDCADGPVALVHPSIGRNACFLTPGVCPIAALRFEIS